MLKCYSQQNRINVDWINKTYIEVVQKGNYIRVRPRLFKMEQ